MNISAEKLSFLAIFYAKLREKHGKAKTNQIAMTPRKSPFPTKHQAIETTTYAKKTYAITFFEEMSLVSYGCS
jgi:hypothetical protein